MRSGFFRASQRHLLHSSDSAKSSSFEPPPKISFCCHDTVPNYISQFLRASSVEYWYDNDKKTRFSKARHSGAHQTLQLTINKFHETKHIQYMLPLLINSLSVWMFWFWFLALFHFVFTLGSVDLFCQSFCLFLFLFFNSFNIIRWHQNDRLCSVECGHFQV